MSETMLEWCSAHSSSQRMALRCNLQQTILVMSQHSCNCITFFALSLGGIVFSNLFHFSGHFHLSNLLLDKMKQTAKATGIEGRIINLSSIAHNYTYRKGIRFNKINERKGYFHFDSNWFCPQFSASWLWF